MRSVVDEAIDEALLASKDRYEARGIRVDAELRAATRLVTHDPVLRGAILTIFGALPDRLAPGSSLRIRTWDRAGGDVELVIEGEWVAGAQRGHSDLVALALDGLRELCRARAGRLDVDGDTQAPGHWRMSFLIPSLARDRAWRPVES